jgi:hypothetical protein
VGHVALLWSLDLFKEILTLKWLLSGPKWTAEEPDPFLGSLPLLSLSQAFRLELLRNTVLLLFQSSAASCYLASLSLPMVMELFLVLVVCLWFSFFFVLIHLMNIWVNFEVQVSELY